MLFLHTIGQTWQNTIGWKTLALIVNKSVASSLLGVARLYLIIIAHNAAPVSRAHKKLKFRAESAVSWKYGKTAEIISKVKSDHRS